MGNGWEGCETRRPVETISVAQGRVAGIGEVPQRGRDGEASETCLSTRFHGTHGLDMGGEKGGGAWHRSPKEPKIADPSPICSP